MKHLNPVGQKFGRLTVVALSDKRQGAMTMWECICECGVSRLFRLAHLVAGSIISCGCARRELAGQKNKTHGMNKTRAYRIWAGMRSRCTNAKEVGFKNYGGRGIQICERWKAFQNFLADMGEPGPKMTLDRIDPNGNYEPSNCRWATMKQQQRNRTNNSYLDLDGQRMQLCEWSEVLNIKHTTLIQRLRRGWSVQDALTKPLQPWSRRP